MAGNGGIIGPVNTVTASQAELVTTFNASATFTTQPRTSTADYLVVAGGGAGGSNPGGCNDGGGGGAGG